MLLTLVLCMAAVPFLALALAPGPQVCRVPNASMHYASLPLESLQCYNDYSSYIRCSWREGVVTTLHTQPSLHHLDCMTNIESLCVPSPELRSRDRHAIHCQYNTTLFAIGIDDYFFFKVHHSAWLSATLNLSEHVRVHPPHGLSQRAVKGGGRLLFWKVSYSPKGSVYQTLNYQVGYRRLNQEWTVVELSEMKLEIEPDSLVPGCQYEARVRARAGKGLWSTWSPPVEWKTKEAMPPSPVNLQCVFDGETEVSCSWEVTRELSQFVTYSLCYWSHQDKLSQQCCRNPKVSDKPKDPLLKFSCSFTWDSSQEQIKVNLTPTYNMKLITAHKTVHPPAPSAMQVREDGDNWVVSWMLPKMDNVPLKFQIRYKRTNVQEQAQLYNISSDDPSYHIRAASLLPGEEYEAQVRAVVQPGFFNGIPSDWAEPVQWTTHSASWSYISLVYVITAVAVVSIFFMLFCMLPMCQRRFRMWKVSIPSPFQSKVVEGLMSLGDWSAVHKEPEQVDISKVQVLDKTPESQIYPKLTEDLCLPVWMASTDDSGTYKCITQHGWDVSTNHDGEDKLSKDTLLKDLKIPFSFQPSVLALSGMADLGQLCVEDSSYVPTSQASLPTCVSDYVEAPVSKRKLWQKDPKEAILQGLLEPSSLAYTQPPLP
ncbi:cytokine receptor common subunit beta-like [Arapaima gigas]